MTLSPDLRDTCTTILTAALFLASRKWSQSRCPTTDKRIRKLWCVDTTEFYPARKEDETIHVQGKETESCDVK